MYRFRGNKVHVDEWAEIFITVGKTMDRVATQIASSPGTMKVRVATCEPETMKLILFTHPNICIGCSFMLTGVVFRLQNLPCSNVGWNMNTFFLTFGHCNIKKATSPKLKWRENIEIISIIEGEFTFNLLEAIHELILRRETKTKRFLENRVVDAKSQQEEKIGKKNADLSSATFAHRSPSKTADKWRVTHCHRHNISGALSLRPEFRVGLRLGYFSLLNEFLLGRSLTVI